MVTTTSFGKASFLIMAGLLGVVATTSAQAEVAEVSLARQYGLHYLPLVLMERNNLIEKHAKAAKVDLKVSWKQFSGGASVNEALISGALNIVAGGTGPLVTIWDKTKSNMGVKGFAAISEVPMVLLSRNPAFKSLKDISPKDRIALPAVKTSMQAITLQMAAAKLYGAKEYTKLDSQTVSMAHPGDAREADSQMFISLSAQPKWNGQYTVFGQVISGMDVVRKLAVTDRIVRVTLRPEPAS